MNASTRTTASGTATARTPAIEASDLEIAGRTEPSRLARKAYLVAAIVTLVLIPLACAFGGGVAALAIHAG